MIVHMICDDVPHPLSHSLPLLKPCSSYSYTHISKLYLSQLSQCADHFATNFGGNVELGQGHVRRAEERILVDTHDGERRRPAGSGIIPVTCTNQYYLLRSRR